MAGSTAVESKDHKTFSTDMNIAGSEKFLTSEDMIIIAFVSVR